MTEATTANGDPGLIEGLVSTVIPVFNRAQMLREAVESVLAQTWRPIEIIISDDGSSDETPDVAAELAAANPGIVLIVRNPNQGPGPAREAGRVLARGEFIQYLDSDDRLLPEKFERQVASLRQRPECEIAYGYTRLVDEEGNELAAPFKWTARDLDFLMPGLLVDRWWCTHTPLYRRRLTDRIGAWTDMRWSQDWEYDSRAAALGAKLVSCHAYVSEHRQHSGTRQTSKADWRQDPVRLRNRVTLLMALWTNAQRAGVDGNAPERQHFARWAFSIARQCAAAGLSPETRECIRLAIESSEGRKEGLKGVKAFSWATRLLGPVAAGRVAGWLSRRRKAPSSATLPQSFSVPGDGREGSADVR